MPEAAVAALSRIARTVVGMLEMQVAAGVEAGRRTILIPVVISVG